jgi:hypothetical protein
MSRAVKRRTTLPTETSNRFHEVWSALDAVIEAWESLEGGTNHSPRVIERWLAEQMSPAISRARVVMGRRRPG